jgi:hypothetical protein
MNKRIYTHEELSRQLYRLNPHIRVYDEFMALGPQWQPYTMFFHPPHFHSDVLNTDALGFRFSALEDSDPVSLGHQPKGRTVNLLVGGSAAFGMGATKDARTAASRLSAWTGEPWLNLGGRGYNATQEALMFMLNQHRFERIRHVVILSGAHTLALEGRPENLASEHGHVEYASEYSHYMAQYQEDRKPRAGAHGTGPETRDRGFLSRYMNLLRPDEKSLSAPDIDTSFNVERGVRRAAWTVSNALKQWRQLLTGTDAQLSFVLQPVACWTRNYLHPAELEMFHSLDHGPNNFWRGYSNLLGPQAHLPYAKALRATCHILGIRFEDMNVLLRSSPHIGDALFVDRLHCSDKGYDEVARLIEHRLL